MCTFLNTTRHRICGLNWNSGTVILKSPTTLLAVYCAQNILNYGKLLIPIEHMHVTGFSFLIPHIQNHIYLSVSLPYVGETLSTDHREFSDFQLSLLVCWVGTTFLNFDICGCQKCPSNWSTRTQCYQIFLLQEEMADLPPPVRVAPLIRVNGRQLIFAYLWITHVKQ